MEFGALHRAECGGVLIVHPISVWPDDNNFVAKEAALTEISFPIIRDENLVSWNHPKGTGRPGKTDRMKRKRIWGQTCAKKSGGAGGDRQGYLGVDVLRRLGSL